MRIASIASYSQATHIHRSVWPFKWLSQDRPQHQWKVSTTDQVQGFEVLWLYNGLRDVGRWANVALLKKRKGVRLALTLDDDIWNFPDWRSDQPDDTDVGSVTLGCEVADLVVCSTEALASVAGHPHKTVVCPNLIEPELFRTPTPPPDDNGPVRILWAGGGGHWADLNLIDDACCRIKEKWGSKVAFYFIGGGPDRMLRDYWNNGVQYIKWVPLDDYWDTLRQVRPHIVLSPLVDCPFNRSKSNIRILDAWALNAAVVASPVGEYKLVRDHRDGLAVATEDDWFYAIDGLVRDRHWRESLAAEGWRRVTEEWSWSSATGRAKWQPVLEWVDQAEVGAGS